MKQLPFFILAMMATSLFSCQKAAEQTRALVPDTVAQDIQDTSTIIGTWLLTKNGNDTIQAGFQLLQGGKAATIGESADSLMAWSTKENDTDTTITMVSRNRKSEKNDTATFKLHFRPKENLLTLNAENVANTYIRTKE